MDKISLRVHHADTMYYQYGGASHYLSVGLSAIRCINESLANSSKKITINTILDFPSGHGRVLRYLKPAFPKAEITASEIDADSLKFCRRNFSVETVLSNKNFEKISLPQKYGLIWCGSLFTHIEEYTARNLLKFFHDHLSDHGVCVFTTQGLHTIELIQSKKQTYRLAEEAQRKLLDEFEVTGYGYAHYVNEDSYGVSVVSPERLRELAEEAGNWNQVMFLKQGWDNHQDVYAFLKVKKKVSKFVK